MMAKIWKNRIMAGTKRLSECPAKYRAQVIELIREDMDVQRLRQLVAQGLMTPAEYEEITGEPYDE